jgi:hypothetical protein
VTSHPHLCRAIRTRTLVEFDYDGHHRIVAPYCHGVTSKNVEVLRAIQVGGSSRSSGFGFGKLWHVDKITNLRGSDEKFLPTDPHYNPDDSVMMHICCRV